MAIDIFEYSNRSTIGTGPTETWTVEAEVLSFDLLDVAHRPRNLVIEISDPNNVKQNASRYTRYQRVRLRDIRDRTIIFLGRVERIEPSYDQQTIKLICRDYLNELSERTSSTSSSISDDQRSTISRNVVDTFSFEGTGWGTKNIAETLQIDASNYIENIAPTYGNDSSAGFKTALQSLEDLVGDEPWQIVEPILFYNSVGPAWTDRTAESWSGSAAFNFIQVAADRFYFGSLAIFSGMDFTLSVNGSYGAQTWEYWNGAAWTTFVPSTTFGFNAATGTVSWGTLAGWVSATLVATGSTPPNDVTSDSAAFISDFPAQISRFWVRVSVASVTIIATITNIFLNPRPGAGWDFRVEDPVPPRRTWLWNNAGGAYVDNTSAAFYEDATTFSSIVATADRLYIGFDYPVEGIEFGITTSNAHNNLVWEHGIDTDGDGDIDIWPALFDANAYLFTASGNSRWNATDITESGRRLRFITRAKLFTSSLNTYVDSTTAARNTTTNDVFLLPAIVDAGLGDIFYVGSFKTFDAVLFQIGTAGAGTWTITWEYWSGAAWTGLSNVVDGTNGFRNGGTRSVSFDLPTNWAQNNVDGTTTFWIRGRVSAFTIMTIRPIADRIDILLWNKGSLSLVEAAAPPNTNQLYWIRLRTTVGVTAATIQWIKSVSIASFKLFKRSKEPWNAVISGEWTLTSVDASPQSNGLTYTYRTTYADQTYPIIAYDVGEQPIEFYNRIVVRGRRGATGTAENTSSQTNIGVIKENTGGQW